MNMNKHFIHDFTITDINKAIVIRIPYILLIHIYNTKTCSFTHTHK